MTDKSLQQHTAELEALCDKVLNQHRYSLAQLDPHRCDICDKPANSTVYSKRTVAHYCEEHDPKPESERMGVAEYDRRQYERHGPDGGV